MRLKLNVAARAYNLSPRKANSEGLYKVCSQSDLHREFHTSQGYVASHCLKKQTTAAKPGEKERETNSTNFVRMCVVRQGFT